MGNTAITGATLIDMPDETNVAGNAAITGATLIDMPDETDVAHASTVVANYLLIQGPDQRWKHYKG